MIAYFDTSAVVPLVVEEPASELASELWDRAERVVSVRLVDPEGRAALARAHRIGRLTAEQLRSAVRGLEHRMDELDIIEIDDGLALAAGAFAEARALRGYDAVHLAAADRLRDADLVVVAGDAALIDAASAEGFATAPLG